MNNLPLDNSLPSKPPMDKSKYLPFGDLADTIYQQGFYPQSSWFNNGTVYASPYNAAFNDVVIPSQPNQKGNVAFIGYPNKTFDVVIRDKSGNVVHTINKGVSPQWVQDYITKNGGLVDERKNYVGANTQPIVTNQLPMGSNIF